MKRITNTLSIALVLIFGAVLAFASPTLTTKINTDKALIGSPPAVLTTAAEQGLTGLTATTATFGTSAYQIVGTARTATATTAFILNPNLSANKSGVTFNKPAVSFIHPPAATPNAYLGTSTAATFNSTDIAEITISPPTGSTKAATTMRANSKTGIAESPPVPKTEIATADATRSANAINVTVTYADAYALA